MASLINQVSDAVRILRRNRDVSARATHLEAAGGNVPSATIERKTMSTKTAFKRVALVAAAALAIGGISAVSANATPQADTLTASVATSSTTSGVAVTTVLNQSFVASAGADAASITASLVSGPAGNSALPVLTHAGGTDVNAASVAISGGNLISTTTATAGGATTGFTTATLTPLVSGTYVIKFTPAAISGVTNAAALTWTVTVAAPLTPTAADSKAIENADESTSASADSVIAGDKTINAAAQRASIVVTAKNGATDLTAATALTATISGPGVLGISNVGAVTTQTAIGRAITGTAGQNVIGVFSDGTAGSATVTISAGSTVLATKTVVFYGTTAKIVSTVVNSVIPVGALGATLGAITAILTDANGNPVANANAYAVSDTVGVISNSYTAATAVSDSTGKVTFDLVGVAAGTANITITTNTSSSVTTGVSATPVAVRVGAAAANATISFNNAQYLPGEAAIITVTVLDAAGKPVPNAPYIGVFAADLVSNYALSSGSLSGSANITTTGSTGTATFKVNMPLANGTIVISATGGTLLAAANQVTISGSAVVAADTSAQDAANSAADIAAEALDAANAATDAATAAADAADAATSAAQDAVDAANAATDAANTAADTAANAETAANAATDAANAAADAADSATAAAQDAADAANAATDAANKAADQAGQALAAVNALATSVASLLASVKAQLTSLTNLVVKIQKKVQA